MMKPAELRELDAGELEQRVKDLDDQLFRMRMQKSMGQLDSSARLQSLRRDVARLKTILREKKRS